MLNGRRFRLVTGTHGPAHLVEVDGVTHRISRDEGGVVRAPAPALVVATPPQVGDEVEAGAPMLVLESMKMETVLRAPFRGKLRERAVSVGSQVEAGELLRLEPLGDQADAPAETAGQSADLALPPEPEGMPARDRAAAGLAALRGRLRGFDLDPHDPGGVLAGDRAARAELVASGSRPLAGEVELLEVFADLSELSRNKPAGEEAAADTRVHSPREYFHRYLQSLDTERAGLPERFRNRMAKALGHYGVHSLERTPELESAVFRIFLAQQRAGSDVAVVTSLLRQWLTEPPPDNGLREAVAQALEHLVAATQLRFPVVSDLARSLVFRWAAQPMLRRARAEAYANVRKHLRYLDRHPDSPDREERIAEMVASPEPLVRLLSQRIARQGATLGPLLEVMSRRYYRESALADVRCATAAGRTCVTARHEGEGRQLRLVATAAEFADLGDAMRAIAELPQDLAAGPSDLVADIYLTWSDQPADVDAMARRLHELVCAGPLPERLRRVTTSVAPTLGSAVHHHFTFRSSPDGFTEDQLIRGLHPMIAQRLQLHRWRGFELTRLPSADEEVHLFRCVAPENAADERLVAMAQVRDLTPLRDAEGRLLALPAVEGVLDACLEAIRKAQSHHPATERLDTNRILVYVWPVSWFSATELDTIVQRVLPTTAGAGLEEIVFLARQADAGTGTVREVALRMSYDPASPSGVRVEATEPPAEPIRPLDDYRQRVLRARRRGTVYPYELIGMLTGESGSFTEHDLDGSGALVPVDRPRGQNTAAIIAGVVSTPTRQYPEGVTRVVLFGDPTKALGAVWPNRNVPG